MNSSIKVPLAISAVLLLVVLCVAFGVTHLAKKREESAPTYEIMQAVKEHLPELTEEYPSADFENPDFIRDNECGYYYTEGQSTYRITCSILTDGDFDVDVMEVLN